MNRFIKFFLALGFLHLAYGIVISFWKPTVLPSVPGPYTVNQYYDYAGVLNVHSELSSGSGTYDNIVTAAQNAGLNFLILTDTNNFNPDLNFQGYKENVLVFVGGEFNYLDARLLNFDIHSTEHLQGPGRSQMIFADLLGATTPPQEAGIFVIPHPLKKGYQLKGEYPPGLTGIELLNLKNIWQDTWRQSKASFFWTLFVYPFNPNFAFTRMLVDAFDDELRLFDKLNQKNRFYGFAGADADAKLKLWGDSFIRFPSYETLFSIARNHILIKSELTGSLTQDQKKVADALRNGQFYLSVDILQNPRGFESYLTGPRSLQAPLGSKIKHQEGMELIVRLPSKPLLPFQVNVYKNGEKILTSTSPVTTLAIHSPGAYRSVVRLKVPLLLPDGRRWVNWIVTNPIFVD